MVTDKVKEQHTLTWAFLQEIVDKARASRDLTTYPATLIPDAVSVLEKPARLHEEEIRRWRFREGLAYWLESSDPRDVWRKLMCNETERNDDV